MPSPKPQCAERRRGSRVHTRRCSFPATPFSLSQRFRADQITARKPNQPNPEAGSRRARASDILLTQDAYKIEPGWACRAEPGTGVGDVPPRPGVASLPSVSFLDPTRSGSCGGSWPASCRRDCCSVAVQTEGEGSRLVRSPDAAWPKRRLVPPSPRTAAPASWAIDRRSHISRPRICRRLGESGWFRRRTRS